MLDEVHTAAENIHLSKLTSGQDGPLDLGEDAMEESVISAMHDVTMLNMGIDA